MRHCLRRSKFELRGPGNGIKIGPRSSRGVRSAPFFRADAESAGETTLRPGAGGACLLYTSPSPRD
eukprot:9375717-Alexandrium_andersonii.AAC.1